MLPKSLSALKQENFVVVLVSKSASNLYASPTENTYPNYHLSSGRTRVRSLKFPPCCFCLFRMNHGIISHNQPAFGEFSVVRSVIRHISDNLRSRVIIYLEIDLSLSRPRWFQWMESNADPPF